MSKADTWMPIYISEYLADTMHLNAQQHGAYMLLLMHHWRSGGVPKDDAQLTAIARCDGAAWKKSVWPVLQAFFTDAGDKLIQKRAMAERELAEELTSTRSKAGKEGAQKRWGRSRKIPPDDTPATASDTSAEPDFDGKRIANALAKPLANGCQEKWQNDAPIPIPILSPDLRSVESAGASAPPDEPKPQTREKRASRLPADWQPSDADRALAAGLGLDIPSICAKFCDYWHAAAGQNARKHDWSATWRNWCRREAETIGRAPKMSGLMPVKSTQWGEQRRQIDALFGPEPDTDLIYPEEAIYAHRH